MPEGYEWLQKLGSVKQAAAPVDCHPARPPMLQLPILCSGLRQDLSRIYLGAQLHHSTVTHE